MAFVRLYRNGAQLAATPYDGTIKSTNLLSFLSFGARLNALGTQTDSSDPRLWRGYMDDMAIWNRPLEAFEVDSFYRGRLNGKAVDAVDVATLLARVLSQSNGPVSQDRKASIYLGGTGAGDPVIQLLDERCRTLAGLQIHE